MSTKGARTKGTSTPPPGDGQTRGDRSKRLLDLVMILLGARTPVTYREIREQFSAYQTLNAEAGLRAFERDKADLLELGVPIRYITPDEDDSLEDGGYVIDLKRFKMPEVRLTPDEISALVLAASVAHAMPGGTYPKIVDLALKKLAFDLPELPDTPTRVSAARDAGARALPRAALPARPELGEIYATLESATRLRKRVTLTYQTAATGHGRRSARSIRTRSCIARVRGSSSAGATCARRSDRSASIGSTRRCRRPKPKSPDFERPADFDVKAYAQRSPWTFTTDPPEEVQLALSPEAAEVGERGLRARRRVKRHDGDRTLVTFDCGNLEFAATRILAAKGAIQVVRGDRLRARIPDELDAIEMHYAPTAEAR